MTIARIPFDIEPSFNTGFSESRADAAYPNLWDDLSLAHYPNMGPRVDLYDFSRRRSRANLLGLYGAPDFSRENGQWGYEHASTGTRTWMRPTIDQLVADKNVTFVLGYKKTDSTLRQSGAFGSNATANGQLSGVLLPWTTGAVYWDFGGALDGAGRINTTTHGSGNPTMGDDCWVFTSGTRGMEIWQNGIRIAHHATANRTRAVAASNFLQWGTHKGYGSDLALYKYFLVYNRVLSFEEIDLITRLPKAPLVLKSPVVFSVAQLDQSLSHNLSLIDIGSGSVLDKDVSHGLGLSDLATGVLDNVSYASASTSLGITDFVFHFLAIEDRQVPTDVMDLTDSVFSPSNPFVSDDLGLTDSVSFSGPKGVQALNELRLNDYVHSCFGTPWIAIEVSHTMELVGRARVPYELAISHSLALTDSGERLYGSSSYLNLTQFVSAGIGYYISQELGMSDGMVAEWDYIRETSDADFLQDAFTFHIDDGCNRKQYTRFEGSGEAEGIGEEPLTFEADFVLETLSGPKETLALRSPETDDKHRLGFSRINRETRGGELNVYQDPTWPVVHTLLFTLTAISDSTQGCPDKINDLTSFFQNHLGEEVMIHDWEGISWKGVVTTPGETAVEDSPRWWTISFEFEGEQLDGSQGDQTLGITDTMTHNADYNRSLSDTMELSDVIGVNGLILMDINQSLGLSDSLDGSYNESTALLDDFSGLVGTDLHGQSPDVGGSTWAAHTNYKADGSQTAIDSGAYYPFVPVHGNLYYIEWDATLLAESSGYETTFFLGEGLNANADATGSTAYGGVDPTTLKAGFVLREIAPNQLNACRMGDATYGASDTLDFSDATLKAESDNIDLRLILNTQLVAGLWTVTWYAKDPADSAWTEVRAEARLLDENITMVGWANNNTTTTVDMDRISVTRRELL